MVQTVANAAATRVIAASVNEDIDQTGDAIRRQIASNMAARGARHHRKDHGANGAGCQRVNGGALRQDQRQACRGPAGDPEHEPRIADMENKKQRLRGRRPAAPAQQTPEIERRAEQKEQADRTEMRKERPADEADKQDIERNAIDPAVAGRKIGTLTLVSQFRVKLGTIRPATTEISTMTAARPSRHPRPGGTSMSSASRCINKSAMPRTVTGSDQRQVAPVACRRRFPGRERRPGPPGRTGRGDREPRWNGGRNQTGDTAQQPQRGQQRQ